MKQTMRAVNTKSIVTRGEAKGFVERLRDNWENDDLVAAINEHLGNPQECDGEEEGGEEEYPQVFDPEVDPEEEEIRSTNVGTVPPEMQHTDTHTHKHTHTDIHTHILTDTRTQATQTPTHTHTYTRHGRLG